MIKRGVSLYSYQQEQFFRRMNWKDMIREVHDSLNADGIEIIDEAVVRDYPFPSEQFIFDWNNEMARWGMKAVTMDVYLDVHQFRDHVMTHAEAAERLKNDIKLAARMGFENVRCLCLVPIDVIEMALPTAEKYNVRIGKEIHAPLPIKRRVTTAWADPVLDYRMAQQIMELADKTGSKYVGLVPDFGIFQHSPSLINIEYMKRHAFIPEAVDFIVENRTKMTGDELQKKLDELYPDHKIQPMQMSSLAMNGSSAQPEDLREIVPYILSIHGKFYEMTETVAGSGCYEDKSIDYVNPIRILKEEGYVGYINSEYEGQRSRQDMGIENLADEVGEVRRHHEMLQRLIGA